MTLPVLALISALAAVNGSGVKKTEPRAVEAFTAIESSGAWNVEVVAGPKVTVEISGDDNIVPLIATTSKGGVLVISSSESNINVKLPVVVKIALPSLTGIDMSGAGNASIVDVKATKLALGTTGAGNISLKGTADDVSVKSTGAGQVVLAGKGKSLTATVTGAGNIDASAFEVPVATIKSSGAGNVAVNATTSLDLDVSGAGSVVYSGNPKVAKKVSGAGTIRAKDAPPVVKDAVVVEPPKKARGGW